MNCCKNLTGASAGTSRGTHQILQQSMINTFEFHVKARKDLNEDSISDTQIQAQVWGHPTHPVGSVKCLHTKFTMPCRPGVHSTKQCSLVKTLKKISTISAQKIFVIFHRCNDTTSILCKILQRELWQELVKSGIIFPQNLNLGCELESVMSPWHDLSPPGTTSKKQWSQWRDVIVYIGNSCSLSEMILIRSII